jgi:hypothetical protein
MGIPLAIDGLALPYPVYCATDTADACEYDRSVAFGALAGIRPHVDLLRFDYRD